MSSRAVSARPARRLARRLSAWGLPAGVALASLALAATVRSDGDVGPGARGGLRALPSASSPGASAAASASGSARPASSAASGSAASAGAAVPTASSRRPGACPPEMVLLRTVCIDRWEVSLVDDATGQPLSPYYPPHPALLERVRRVWQAEAHWLGPADARRVPLPPLPAVQLGAFTPRAVSRPGVVPQGYLNLPLARQACVRAGKRLCSEEEWVVACEGRRATKFPYGAHFEPGACNIRRAFHPAAELHAHSSVGHTDPRLNLVVEPDGAPLLAPTGSYPRCESDWASSAALADGPRDMVGNLDEWIEDDRGVFVGGFYARQGGDGCAARIADHAPLYYDYSLGTRCCQDAR